MKPFNILLSICFILSCDISISNQQELNSFYKSNPNDSYYTAGVVEFQVNRSNSVNENLNEYQKIIESTEAKETDIIVFPEGTFNTFQSSIYVPNPNKNVTLCNDTGILQRNTTVEPLTKLSCLAKKVKKYLVINLTEKQNCSAESQKAENDIRPCAPNGLSHFNTNVVFDRNGTVIARYRKWHLYSENVNITARPEYATFKTDFGVTFGLFTCFDILFYTPTLELVKKGVHDFVFPTMWFSELPFLTAVQQQHSWAYANNVNLLAAGASNPHVGSTGSGIYAGKQGALTDVMSSEAVTKLLVAKVPKGHHNATVSINIDANTPMSKPSVEKNEPRLKGIKLLRDEIDTYNSTFLKLSDLSIKKEICNKSLCCKFDIEWKMSSKTINNSKSYEYILASFEGERTYQERDTSFIRVCALIACTNQTLSSCGKVFYDNETVENLFAFNKINIEGNFLKYPEGINDSLIGPNNVDEMMLPLNVNEYNFNITLSDDTKYEVAKCELKDGMEKSNLLTFGIYANDFKNSDGGKSFGTKINFSIITMIMSFLLPLIYIKL